MSDSATVTTVPSRTLLLWLAALVVTWLSGIEPTSQKVMNIAHRYEEINRQLQQVDHKASALQQQLGGKRAEQLDADLFAALYPPGPAREQERTRRFDRLRGAQAAQATRRGIARVNPALALDAARPCDSPILSAPPPVQGTEDRGDDMLISALEKLRNFCTLERLVKQAQSGQWKEERARQGSLQTAEEKKTREAQSATRADAENIRDKSNVDFELLGVKFTAEPLLASLLWCSFACAWLFAARQEALKAWTPATIPAHIDAASALFNQLRLITMLGLLTWAVQLRITWLGLVMTSSTGGMHWKALVASVVALLAVGSAVPVAVLLTHRLHLAPQPALEQLSNRRIGLAMLAVAGVAASAWWLPAQVLWLLHGAKPALPVLGALPLLLSVWVWYYQRQHRRRAAQPSGRRRVLLQSACAMALVLGGAAAWQLHRRARAAYAAATQRRHRRRAQRLANNHEPGFYRNSNPRKQDQRRTIVFYVSGCGETAARAQLPDVMKPILPPVYVWQDALEHVQLQATMLDQFAETTHTATSALPDWLQPWNLEKCRVMLPTASWSFEQAALLLLEDRTARRKHARRACELLLTGILHDLRYKKNHGNPRKRSAPSYRLYDLAAGLAVRYRVRRVIPEMKRRIEQAEYGLVFQSRFNKWDNVNSAWYRRWHDRSMPLRWQSGQQVSVF